MTRPARWGRIMRVRWRTRAAGRRITISREGSHEAQVVVRCGGGDLPSSRSDLDVRKSFYTISIVLTSQASSILNSRNPFILGIFGPPTIPLALWTPTTCEALLDGVVSLLHAHAHPSLPLQKATHSGLAKVVAKGSRSGSSFCIHCAIFEGPPPHLVSTSLPSGRHLRAVKIPHAERH